MGVESRSPPPASRRLRLAGRSLPGQRQLLAQAHYEPRLSLYIALFVYLLLATLASFSPIYSISFSRSFPTVSLVFFTLFAPPLLFRCIPFPPPLAVVSCAEIQRESSTTIPLGYQATSKLGLLLFPWNFRSRHEFFLLVLAMSPFSFLLRSVFFPTSSLFLLLFFLFIPFFSSIFSYNHAQLRMTSSCFLDSTSITGQKPTPWFDPRFPFQLFHAFRLPTLTDVARNRGHWVFGVTSRARVLRQWQVCILATVVASRFYATKSNVRADSSIFFQAFLADLFLIHAFRGTTTAEVAAPTKIPLSRWPFSSSCFWRPCSFTPANDKRWINIQATSSFFHFYPHLALFKYPFASICSLPDVVDAKDLASMHLRAAFVRAPPPARAQSLSMVNKNRWSTLCR